MGLQTTKYCYIIDPKTQYIDFKRGGRSMIAVNVTGGELSQKEIDLYIDHSQKKYPERKIESMDIHLDGEYVDLTCHFETVPLERIRRITGYLVGTLDRFNNAKRAEVDDRVKHSICCDI